jgi:hypothetical protein
MSQTAQIVVADRAGHGRRPRGATVWRLVIWSGAAFSLLSSAAGCAGRSAAEQQPSAEAICDKMCAAIESVSRGIVRVDDETSNDGQRAPIKTTFRLVFDDSTMMLRCDEQSKSRHTKYARTPVESLFLEEGEGAYHTLSVGAPDRDLSRFLGQPLDPHLLWFAGAGGYLTRQSYADVKHKWFGNAKAAAVSKDPAGRFVLRWTTRLDHETDENVHTLIVDPTLGFVPVRNEVAVRRVGSTESQVTAWTEIRYEKKNAYAVPVSLDIHENGGHTIKVTCHWESVNQHVDPKVFTVEGFEASKGTRIVDMRGPQPVLLSVIGAASRQDPRRSTAASPSVPAARSILNGVERTILKEPKYVSSPRYALLVFGEKAESKVWMVEDGKTLYVDKNGNSDLTDDGPPIVPTNGGQVGSSSEGIPQGNFHYVLDKITPTDGSQHTAFRLRRWTNGAEEDGYGLSLDVNGRTQMYAGWTSFWAASPGAAPVIHFAGPLEPRMLRLKEFVIDSLARRLSIAFINPGRGECATSLLGIDALPPQVIPTLQIDWPVEKGAPVLHTSLPLRNRCCYWEFYNLGFKVPAGTVPGTATVTVSMQGGSLPFELIRNQIKVSVRAKAAETAGQ